MVYILIVFHLGVNSYKFHLNGPEKQSEQSDQSQDSRQSDEEVKNTIQKCYFYCLDCGLLYINVETNECLDNCPTIDFFNNMHEIKC